MNISYRDDVGVAFDLSTLKTKWVVRVPLGSIAVVQASRFGTWSTAVITIQKSLDGANPVALSPAVTLGPPSGSTVFSVITDRIACDGFEYLHISTSTSEASASCDVRVTAN